LVNKHYFGKRDLPWGGKETTPLITKAHQKALLTLFFGGRDFLIQRHQRKEVSKKGQEAFFLILKKAF